jgi:uncharacterized Zn ribbon protein
MREDEYKRNCPECFQDYIAKRSDQIFCRNKCRYDFNNRIARAKRKNILPVDSILHKNRKVLMELYKDTKTVSRDELLKAGFNFSFHTHSLQDGNKVKYDFVYEFGITQADKDNYKIVKHAAV